jgi:hypothetical protein
MSTNHHHHHHFATPPTPSAGTIIAANPRQKENKYVLCGFKVAGLMVLGSMEFPMGIPPPFSDVDTGCDIVYMPDVASAAETIGRDARSEAEKRATTGAIERDHGLGGRVDQIPTRTVGG